MVIPLKKILLSLDKLSKKFLIVFVDLLLSMVQLLSNSLFSLVQLSSEHVSLFGSASFENIFHYLVQLPLETFCIL
jgi:hypothetical protein